MSSESEEDDLPENGKTYGSDDSFVKFGSIKIEGISKSEFDELKSQIYENKEFERSKIKTSTQKHSTYVSSDFISMGEENPMVFSTKGNLESLESFDSVVQSWSLRTQEAWINNMKFTLEDVKEVRMIRHEIINSLVDKLFEIHGTFSVPRKAQIKEILQDIHMVKYPWMFSKGPDTKDSVPGLNSGKALGGVHGIDNLPKQIWDKWNEKTNKAREALAVESRKGRKPPRFGISDHRYYTNAKKEEIEA